MAITTYAELQTSLANWLSRADQTANLPDFVALAEAKFNRELRTRNMELSATITPVERVAALPSDFLELRRIYINSAVPQELEYLPPEQFWIQYPAAASNPLGPSKYYTIEGSNIRLSDNTGTDIVVLYYQKIPALAANSTNWLLTNHPDLYMAGALAEAYDLIKNEALAAKWTTKMIALMEYIRESDWRGKYSGSAMRVTSA